LQLLSLRFMFCCKLPMLLCWCLLLLQDHDGSNQQAGGCHSSHCQG
jgi:hypothetical protein